MATYAGKIKTLIDNQLRVNSSGATTVSGTAQNKGTSTDLILKIIVGLDGATAVGGTTIPVIQGSNISAFTTPTTVTADKGTLSTGYTAAATQTLHFGNLQFQFYRVQVTSSAAATCNVSCVWDFHPVQDSFDATVQ